MPDITVNGESGEAMTDYLANEKLVRIMSTIPERVMNDKQKIEWFIPSNRADRRKAAKRHRK